MSENFIPITNLNDFIFCPASIYFHNLDYETDRMEMQCSDQINGTASHQSLDNGVYSSSTDVLTGIPVVSEKYGVYGKIDFFNNKTHTLIERKKRIKKIYDGYIFQLYAQYFSLKEMGYTVTKLAFHSMDDNKTYDVVLPEDDKELLERFIMLIEEINSFSFEGFMQKDESKCRRCIYEPLCCYSPIKELLC